MATPDLTQNVSLTPFTVPPPPSADTLNTDVNKMLPLEDFKKQISSVKTPEDIRQIQTSLLDREIKNTRDIQKNKMLQEQMLASADVDINRQARERAQNIEKTYQDVREKYPYPELHPTQDNIQTLAGLFSLIGVIGTAIGGQGRMSAMNALGAMTGMMKGWQQGRQDLWVQEKQKFDENMKRVKSIIDDAKADADRALKLMAYDVNEAQSVAKQSAAKLGSQVGNQILDNQGILLYKKYADGVERAVNRKDEILERRRIAAQAHADAVAAKQAAASSQLGAGNYLHSLIGRSAKNEKINEQIVGDATAAARIDKLLTSLKDKDIRTGVSAALNNTYEKLKSTFGNNDLTDDQIRSAVDFAISPTDRNAVFLKDALFTAFEAERAAQGGRLTVQIMKQAGSVLDPTNYTKEAYAGILGGRRDYLLKDMRGKGMTENEIKTVIQDESKPSLGYGFSTPETTVSTKPMPSGDKLKSYANEHFNGDINKAKEFLSSKGYR